MSLWTRKGYLIPLLWLLGFVVIYWVDQSVPGTLPEEWIFTAGHILGSIFVAAFAFTWGGTTTKEIIDVASGEEQTVYEPHLFLIFPAKIWAVILFVAMGLMFFQPPPKSILDKAFFQTSRLEKKLKQVGAEAIGGGFQEEAWGEEFHELPRQQPASEKHPHADREGVWRGVDHAPRLRLPGAD
jgi:hypothetical protein